LLAAGGAVNGAPDPDPTPQVADRAIAITRFGGGSFLGVAVAEIDSERAKALNLREERGVEITRVEEESPAAKAGIKTGDVVLEYNGQRVEGMDQFMRMVRETPPGREVKLAISRSGGLQNVVVKTESRKTWTAKSSDGFPRAFEFPNIVIPDIQIPDIPKAYMSWRSSILGVEAESVDSQLAQYFGVKEGVLVRSVIKGSAAEKAGLKAGDVITRVDGASVSNPREVSTAIRTARSKKSTTLTVMRDRKEVAMTVPLEDRENDGDHAARPTPQRRAITVHTGPRYLIALED
jgi:serine protease Do